MPWIELSHISTRQTLSVNLLEDWRMGNFRLLLVANLETLNETTRDKIFIGIQIRSNAMMRQPCSRAGDIISHLASLLWELMVQDGGRHRSRCFELNRRGI